MQIDNLSEDARHLLIHDLHTALYSLETVTKYLKSENLDPEMVFLQEASIEKIENVLEQLKLILK